MAPRPEFAFLLDPKINRTQVAKEFYDSRKHYRLGDLLYGVIDSRAERFPETNPTADMYCQNWPNSLGCKLTLTNATRNKQGDGIKQLCKLVDNFNATTPSPSPTTLVIHLRLGDVLDYRYYRIGQHCTWNAGCHYVWPIDHYRRLIKRLDPKINDIVVIGNPEYRRIGAEGHRFTDDYVERVKREFETHKAKFGGRLSIKLNNSADEDFVFMSRASFLAPARGSGFSKAAVFCARSRGSTVYDNF